MNLRIVTGLIAGGLVAGAPAVAHHSFAAAYNMDESITVTGTIARVRLTNPHSFFFIDVEDENGDVVQWSFEAGTPGAMIRNGYSTEVMDEGDTVTVSGFRARDPSKPSGMLDEIRTEDGTVWGMFAPVEGPGAR